MVDVPTTDFAGYHGRNRPFPFCGRIIEAYYTNPELDTVCVTYREDEQLTPDGEPRAYDYYMEVDETDARFQALLKEYSYEDLQTTTEERHKIYRKDFQNIVGDQKHKEELFRLKLRLFETEAGQSASRSQKAKIRKAETPIEIIHHYYDIVKPKKRTRSKQPVHSVKEG